MYCTNAVINGDVQGRGCRNSIGTLARTSNITGISINRGDGSVEVFAYHDDPRVLDTFLDDLDIVPRDNINLVQHHGIWPCTTPVPSSFTQR